MELLERADALDRLEAGPQHAAAGRGRIVAVTGPAGMGKTALVASFLLSGSSGARVLAGAGRSRICLWRARLSIACIHRKDPHKDGEMDAHDSAARTVVITGANAGIGRRAAELMTSQGHTVIAVARSAERGSRAVTEIRATTGSSAVSLEIADMADPASITALAERLRVRHGRVDALINNAAVFDQTASRSLTRHGHEQVWATNHLGPFLLTAELSSLLARSGDARVVTVASKGLMVYPRIAIRWDDLLAEGWFTPTRAYYHSKLAQVMFAAALARRVPPDQLISVTLRVPAVRLDADRLAAMPLALRLSYAPKNRFAFSPDRVASTYARLAVGPRDAVARLHGCYVDEDTEPVAAPRYARDEAAQDRLWRVTSRQVGDPAWPGLDIAA